MKFLVLTFIVLVLLVGHVLHSLHKARVEGHIDAASRVIVRGLR